MSGSARPIKHQHSAVLETGWVRWARPVRGASLFAAFVIVLSAQTPAAQHWAFQSLKDSPPPKVRNYRWPATDIDRFILAALEARKLQPNPPADRFTLLRRVTFDLLGLPPTVPQIDAFVNDPSTDAFAKVVDRLLGSPEYGERWGRHWLDLARYADTAGDSADYPVPQAYKYRDYVIASFNANKPYDEFLIEQIAGDLMPATSERQRRERIVATGFLASARRFSVEPDHAMYLTIEDALDTIGRSVLGLSFSCARCHDHKYDPVSMRDYYGLYGIFGSTRFPYAGSEVNQKQRDFVSLMSDAETARIYAPFRQEWDKLDQEVKRFQKEIEFLKREGLDMSQAEIALKAARRKRRQLEDSAPPFDTAYAVGENKPTNAPIHLRGQPATPGDVVPRGGLDALGKALTPAFTNSIGPIGPTSGRYEFALWLTDVRNPLTARVMVNRIWQHHFGKGLVATTGDFGTRGEEPSHPELLDYLARRFAEDGWSIKALQRLILLSAAYQQTSFQPDNADPENRWLSRMNRKRLEAEAVRDSMLAVAEQLDRSVAGEHPFPAPQDWEFTQHAPFTALYPTARRSVYVMQQRIRRHPFFATFDGADPNASTAQRTVSVTPLQALFSMNDKFAHEQAEGFARRICQQKSSARGRIRFAYLSAFGRAPSLAELLDAESYVRNGDGPVWNSFARALMASNEFIFLD